MRWGFRRGCRFGSTHTYSMWGWSISMGDGVEFRGGSDLSRIARNCILHFQPILSKPPYSCNTFVQSKEVYQGNVRLSFRSFFSFCHFDSWKRLTFWKEDLSSCFSEIWALLRSFEKIKSKWGVECTNGQLGKILLKIAEFLKVWKQYLFSSFNCFFCHKKSLEWRN